jgi:hypothetical protein
MTNITDVRNEHFHAKMEENSSEIYEAVATQVMDREQGTRFTNNEICLMAGFNPGESIEAAMLSSQISNKIRGGVDRYISGLGMVGGFAKQINMDKLLGEHHLIHGADYVMDQALHLTGRMLTTVSNWTRKSNELYIDNKAQLDRGQKYTFRKLLGMSAAAATEMDRLASPEIPKIISRDESFAPLMKLIEMLDETVSDIES